MRINKKWFLLIILMVAVVLLSMGINKPWIGRGDGCGAFYSICAKNHLKYGFWATKFGSVSNADTVEPEDFKYYLHHPPLPSILIAISFKILGVSELNARLVSFVFTLLTILVLYFFVRDIFDPKTALLSSFFFSTMPMTAVYGTLVNHEIYVTLFLLLTIYFYYYWLTTERHKYFIFMLISFLTGGLFGWAEFYIAGIIPIHYFFFLKRRQLKIIFLPICAVALFGVILFHFSLLKEDFGKDLLEGFMHRTMLKEPSANITLNSFITRELSRANLLFGYVIGVLSLFWLIKWILNKKGKRPNSSIGNQLIFIFYAQATCWILMFIEGAYVHEFWTYYFTIPLSISAARGTILLSNGLPTGHEQTNPYLIAFVILIVCFPNLSKIIMLKNSPYHIERYKVGQIIGERTFPKSYILTTIGAKQNLKEQIEFYAQREIILITKVSDIEENLKNMGSKQAWFVLPNKNVNFKDELFVYDEEIDNYLKKRFKSFVIDKYTFFDLQR